MADLSPPRAGVRRIKCAKASCTVLCRGENALARLLFYWDCIDSIFKVWLKTMLSIVLVLLGCIIAGIVFDSLLVEPRWVRVNRYRFPVVNLPGAFQGFTIVQLSDLHCSRYVSAGYLRRVVRMVNALSPDVVVITGDFVRGTSRYTGKVPGALAQLTELKARGGVFAVRGNHDYCPSIEMVERAVTKAGVRFLTNCSVMIERSGARLVICGVDDLWEGTVSFSAALAGTEAASPKILLMHNPDAFDEAVQYPFDLILCGHTHGGQVVIPLIGPLLVPSRYGRCYASGFFYKDGRTMYVNRGVGLVPPPVRFFCRPEIAAFRLEAEHERLG